MRLRALYNSNNTKGEYNPKPQHDLCLILRSFLVMVLLFIALTGAYFHKYCGYSYLRPIVLQVELAVGQKSEI
jgi:hypothetical protein